MKKRVKIDVYIMTFAVMLTLFLFFMPELYGSNIFLDNNLISERYDIFKGSFV